MPEGRSIDTTRGLASLMACHGLISAAERFFVFAAEYAVDHHSMVVYNGHLEAFGRVDEFLQSLSAGDFHKSVASFDSVGNEHVAADIEQNSFHRRAGHI